MHWPASAGRVVPVATASALLAMFAAGCGGDEGLKPDASRARTAQVGPTCAALRASNDPEYDAYAPLIDFVYEGDDGEGARYDSLTKGQQLLWATRLLEDEINNGGFNQYFFNTNGAILDDAIRGFDVFGTRAHANLARQAGRLYARDRERLAKARAEGTLEAFSDSYDDEPYNALDSKFFRLASPPGRLAYLRSHLREFCVP
jgi:hypothetical protein